VTATGIDGSRPLEGVTILDFTRILSGPYCTLLLADLGADVIKVERPGQGDDTRHWGPPFVDEENAISSYFASLNRGKRSVAVDLNSPEGQAVIRDLAARVDVVVENFRPGVAERLGLTYEHLARANPSLVICSISGFGHDNEYAQLAGTEIVVEAMSGLMHVTGPIDGDPVRFGIAMVDIATGLTAAVKIVASVLVARTTAVGAALNCSLYGTAIAALGTLITSYSLTGEEPRRWGSHHPSLTPYGGFPTADGRLITGVVNDAMWPAFCEALQVEDLADRPEYATNAGRVSKRAELEAAISAATTKQTTAYWVKRLTDRHLLAAPIRTVGEAVDDPVTRGMGLLVGIDGHPGVLSPRLDGVRGEHEEQAVPLVGEHTREVLSGMLRLDDHLVDRLISEGVLGVAGTPSVLAEGRPK
jgi:crotonobetainyl-CoA:carnitine CoA-transferase CaiB-like acyl-CoA transferase